MDFSPKIDNFDVKLNKKSGLKLTENPLNKRESDIFNNKSIINPQAQTISYEHKMKLVKEMENFLDYKLRVFYFNF